MSTGEDLLRLKEIGVRPWFLLGLMLLLPATVTHARLTSITGWSANTVSACLNRLRRKGLARQLRDRGSWELTSRARAVAEALRAAAQTPQAAASKTEAVQRAAPSKIEGGAKDPRKTASNFEGDDSSWLVGGGSGSSNEEDLSDSEAGFTNQPNQGGPAAAVLQALRDAGITGRVREELARMAHVTPEYIRAHALQARREGRSVGAAVYRIRQGWTQPNVRPHTPEEALLLYGEVRFEAEPEGRARAAGEAEAPAAPEPAAPVERFDGSAEEAPPAPGQALPPEVVRAWEQAVADLDFNLGEAASVLRLRPARLIGYEAEAHRLIVWTPDRWVRRYLVRQLQGALERVLTAVTQRPATLKVVCPAQLRE